MMLTGAILGLVGSLIPEGIKIFRDWQDKKHELKMLEMQMMYQRELTELRIQEARAIATLELDKSAYRFADPEVRPTGHFWVDLLQVLGALYNQTVRPTLTYIVIACWIMYKYAGWKLSGGNLTAFLQVWTIADSEFVSAVVMFWFGGRAFKRVFQR